jgi:hypothetical protein
MKNILVTLVLSFFTCNAFATGGFSCSTDSSVDFAQFMMNGVTSRSFENDIISADGLAKGSIGDDGAVYEFDYAFTKQDIRQYWNNGNEFRLVVYSEKEVSNQLEFVKAVITTTTTDGITFSGNAIISSASWSMDLPITCEIE